VALNDLGEQIGRPVTLPPLKLLPIDDVAERRELAERLAQERTVRVGRDAWIKIANCQSFDQWRKIGAALSVGKQHALKVSGASEPWGRNYTHAFSRWAKARGFKNMAASVRSVAIELYENLPAIEAWRATLSEKQRRSLIHPLSNVRRWRAATTYGGKSPADYKMEAVAAWKKFVSCVAMLPTDQAAPLWQMVYQTKAMSDAAAA